MHKCVHSAIVFRFVSVHAPTCAFSQKGPALFVQNKQFQLWLHPWELLLQEPTSQPWGQIQYGHSQSSDWSQPTMS